MKCEKTVKITPNLLDQVKTALDENKKAEAVVKETISDLSYRKQAINNYEQNFKDLLNNYTLFISNKNFKDKDL